jgi:thiamine biosynthesis lipoprotein
VLDHAQQLAADSGGAFDVTLGPLTHLWRTARKKGSPPDPAEVESARARTGYRKLTLDPDKQTATLSEPAMQLDLGGLAKGYAAEAARDVLRNLGMDRSLVAIGGDICVGNLPPDQPWRIGIQSTERVVILRSTCVSTSGDTEQFVEVGGKRYSHILDPRIGLGLTNRRIVTVQAPSGILADSLATALSVLTSEEGAELLRKYPDAHLY